MKKALRMDARDNVATALDAVAAGNEVEIPATTREVVQRVQAQRSLLLGHKIALCPVPENADVITYGAKTGHAAEVIHTGHYPHIRNVTSDRMPLTQNMLGHRR